MASPCIQHGQHGEWYVEQESARARQVKDATSDAKRRVEYGFVVARRRRQERSLELAATVTDIRPLAELFLEQAEKWDKETSHLSSPAQRIMHPSYQAILGMGSEHKDEVIGFLLRDLQENRRAWFWALSYLAQDNPVNSSDSGKFDKMISAWVGWGQARGLL